MNIWIVSAYDPLPSIDLDIRLLRYGSIARALEANGNDVLFWTSTFAHWRKQNRFAQDTTREISPRFKAEFLWAPEYARNVSLARIRHNRALASAFARRASRVFQLPDLIIAEIPCLELAEAAAEFALRHKIPLICDIQDIWPDVYLTSMPRVFHRLGRLALTTEYRRLRRILAAATSVTAVSQAYLEWTSPWLSRPLGATDRVFTLGYTRPPEAILQSAREGRRKFMFGHGIADGDIVVTFLGQFATSYDVITIVRAATLLAKMTNLPPYRIVLAGSGDKDPILRKEAADLRNIAFTGWLKNTEAVCLLQLSHIALAAYTEQAAQSLPYKPFEYMAHGLPIINSLPGELNRMISERKIGLNYTAESPESLASAIVELLTNSGLREASAQNSRNLFEEQYDADKIYTEMANFAKIVVGAA